MRARSSLRDRLDSLRGDGLAAKLSRSSAISMSVRVTGLALAFVLHLILSRMLGASEYGHYVIALGWAMVLVIPARLGLDNSALRYATIYREQHRAGDFRGLVTFSLLAIAGVSAAIGLILLAGREAGIAPLAAAHPMTLISIVLLVPFMAVLGWLSALVRTANRIFASQFYEQVLRPTLLIIAVIAAVLAGAALDSPSAMLLTSATAIVVTIGLAFHSRSAFAGMERARPSFEHRNEWLSVSGVLLLMAIVQELLNQADIILLGIFGNATQAAHFAAAFRLSGLVPFGLIAIATVSAPMIASAYNRGDLGELARIARLNARFSTLFAVAMVLVLAGVGYWALGLFGPGFASAYPALLILLAGGLVNSLTGTVGYLLIMTGRQRLALWILAAALALNAALNILLIPSLGVIGSAIASASALAAWNLAMVYFVRRQLGIDATALGLSPRPVVAA